MSERSEVPQLSGGTREIVWTEEDLRAIPNTISITKQVGETHPQLGSRVAFIKVCDCGEMGLLQISSVGQGKTKCLEAIKKSPHKKLMTKKFTLASSNKFLTAIFTNSEVTWVALELEDMSPTVLENMFRVACDLLEDHECDIKTAHYECDIKNSRISFLLACTYEMYNKMWEMHTWKGNNKERIMRYFVFEYNVKKINLAVPSFHITMNYPPLEKIMVTENDWFREVVDLLRNQFSFSRAYEYAIRLMRGSAALNHRDFTVDADAKFILLHSANIEAEKWASSKKSLASSLVLDIDALQLLSESLVTFGVSIDELIKREGMDNSSSIIRSVYKYPNLFKKIDDWVFPAYSIIIDTIAPQMEFERFCIEEGEKYYLH